MSLLSRLSSLVRSASSNPAVRRAARDLGRSAIDAVQDQERGSRGDGRRDAQRSDAGRAGSGSAPHGAAAGGDGTVLADRSGDAPVRLSYAPHPDAVPDPGEVVWTWVHYEESLAEGKDRPVLVIGQEDAATGGSDGSGAVLVALMLTSKDRVPSGGTARDEHGNLWVDVGTGDWDAQGRSSEVRADRLLRIDPAAVRRADGRLDEAAFSRVAAAVREAHGWS